MRLPGSRPLLQAKALAYAKLMQNLNIFKFVIYSAKAAEAKAAAADATNATAERK